MDDASRREGVEDIARARHLHVIESVVIGADRGDSGTVEDRGHILGQRGHRRGGRFGDVPVLEVHPGDLGISPAQRVDRFAPFDERPCNGTTDEAAGSGHYHRHDVPYPIFTTAASATVLPLRLPLRQKGVDPLLRIGRDGIVRHHL